jgi:hypothetical protein
MTVGGPREPGRTPVAVRTWSDVALRRSGARPLRFRGQLLVEAGSEPGTGRVGHRLRLFETDDGGYVVATEVRHPGCDLVTAAAVRVPSVERVAEALEAFDPRERIDLDVSRALLDGDTDAAALEGLLAGRLDQAVADYRQVVLTIFDDGGGRRMRPASRSDQGG